MKVYPRIHFETVDQECQTLQNSTFLSQVLESSLPPSHSAPDVLMLCRGETVKNSHSIEECYMIGDEDGFVVMIFVGGLVLILTTGGTRHKDE